MIVWRVVLGKLASLQDLETFWSLDDLLKVNALLDMKSEIANTQKQKAIDGSHKRVGH